MSRILSSAQCRQLDADLEELQAYRETGFTPAAINRLVFSEPAPLPMDLNADDDLHLAAGILEDDGFDPAREAHERYDQGRWDK